MVTKRSTGSRAQSFRTSFSQYLRDFGTSVTLNTITETLDSQNRVTDTTTVSTTIKADIQYVTKYDIMHENLGDVEVGDGMLFVKQSTTVDLESEVVFNDVTWRIITQIEGELVQGDVVYKGYIIRRND